MSKKNIKAINATTVEVKFKAEVKDINSLKFTIEGLDVKNAAVKQSDNKTVVLTTASQEGDKEYTLKLNGESLGKFKGISAVTPEKINIETTSLQGIVGKEVTVKAKVEVKEGQSKAGIPVTFNVKTDNTKFNKDHVEEVYTDENGVAQYSYTQYAGGEDLVIAYATGNADKRATNGKVYWGVKERLTVTEVTEKATLPNGAKKVYKVKATTPTGGAESGYVNVAFAENVDVTPDKGVKGASITDASFYGVDSSTSSVKYPYQYTNGNTNAVRVKLDSKGEATFTVTGDDVSVTPVVFFDGGFDAKDKWTGDNKLNSTELQAKADTVKFENIQLVELSVESVGTKDAAGITAGVSDGGRDYKVTVKDKDGKLAPKGTKVYVTVTEDDLSGDVYLGKKLAANKFTGKNSIVVYVDKDGIAEFTLIGEKNAYATPTVYVDNGSKLGELDKTDAQAKGEIVYFGKAVVEAAVLKVKDTNGDAVKSVKTGQTAVFEYQVVDQNGKAYKAGQHNATFEVFNNGYNSVWANGQEVKPFKHLSVPFTTTLNDGKAVLNVTAAGVTSVNVNVSGSQYSLGNKDASVTFTDAKELPATYTGVVESIDKGEEEITFVGYNPVSYAGSTFKNVNGVALNQKDFEDIVKANEGKVRVTAVKDANGKYSFEIVSLNNQLSSAVEEINIASTRTDVVNALTKYSSSFSPAYNTLKNTAQKEAVAQDILNAKNALPGRTLTDVQLNNEYSIAYQAVVTGALADVVAITNVQAGTTTAGRAEALAALNLVPGLDLSSLDNASLTAAGKNNVLNAVVALNGTPAQTASVPALKTYIDNLVAAELEAGSLAEVNAASDNDEMLTALQNLGINLTSLNALEARPKALVLDELVQGTGAYASKNAVTSALNAAIVTHKDDVTALITGVTLNTAGAKDTITIAFSEDIELTASEATAAMESLAFDLGSLGTTATAAYTGSGTDTLVITVDKGDYTVVLGSVLTKINVTDAFGVKVDLTKFTAAQALNLEVK